MPDHSSEQASGGEETTSEQTLRGGPDSTASGVHCIPVANFVLFLFLFFSLFFFSFRFIFMAMRIKGERAYRISGRQRIRMPA